MVHETLAAVFTDAALPQKIVLLVLAGAIPATLAAAVLSARARARDSRWRRLVADLRFAGPGLGLLVGALNSFHMAQTIQRAPFAPTAKQLAPGILEVSSLVGLGALAGLTALAAHVALGLAEGRTRAP